MYCSSCGVAVAQGLSYCNYCGARLNRGDGDGDFDGKASDVRPDFLVFAMMATFIFGLIAITVLMGVMKTVLDVPVERVLGFALVPFLLMLLLEGVFIRLLWRRTQSIKEKSEAMSALSAKGQATNELDAAHARALPEHMPSVTEHTTRAFDPIYKERKSN